MDNVIWLVLASAVFIAAAGILLFITSDSLENVDNESENLQDPGQYIDDSYTESSNFNPDRPEFEKPGYKMEKTVRM